MALRSSSRTLPESPPAPGDLVQVRSRQWLVEEVVDPATPGHSSLVRLACADDDAQGQALDVFWDYEIDRQILKEESWSDLSLAEDSMPPISSLLSFTRCDGTASQLPIQTYSRLRSALGSRLTPTRWNLWVPETRSPHAARSYSWISPPRMSRLDTPLGRPSCSSVRCRAVGGFMSRARWGR